MLVPPVKILLGSKIVRKNGTSLLKKRCGYYIPLKELVEKLLCLPEMWKHLTKHHESQSEIMKDICDGDFVKQHKLSREGRPFLQLILSFDDVEIQNPLRSNALHKLSMFYVTFANIPPQYRSKLQNIFLLAIARSKDLKSFGLDRLLGDFVSTVDTLRETGININVVGGEERIWGDIILATCDTPAAAYLGGFKESSFAYKSCRMCCASANEMKTNFIQSSFVLRDMKTYLDQCTILSDASLSRANKTYWSKQFGLNKKSVLCGISEFDVTQNLVQDPMHCILEGCLPYALALFLKRIIGDLNIVTLAQINAKIADFPYSYLDKNTAETIDGKHIKNLHIKQKASVMLHLAYILPFILSNIEGVNVDDPFYRNIIGLIKITCTIFSPYADVTTAGELDQLMVSFLKNFVELYPEAGLKPKMHYMLHFPRQMLLFGPLRQLTCMRFEAKHGFFKNHKWNNFVNLPFSLAEKHQLYLANRMSGVFGQPCPNFIDTGNVVEEGEKIDLISLPKNVLKALPRFMHGDKYLFKIKSAELESTTYRIGVALLLGEDFVQGPRFGLVDDIISAQNGNVLFIVNVVNVKKYEHNYNAYEIERSQNDEDVLVLKITEIENTWPLPIYTLKGQQYVTNRFSHCVQNY
jgi:hypothetical protein